MGNLGMRDLQEFGQFLLNPFHLWTFAETGGLYHSIFVVLHCLYKALAWFKKMHQGVILCVLQIHTWQTSNKQTGIASGTCNRETETESECTHLCKQFWNSNLGISFEASPLLMHLMHILALLLHTNVALRTLLMFSHCPEIWMCCQTNVMQCDVMQPCIF